MLTWKGHEEKSKIACVHCFLNTFEVINIEQLSNSTLTDVWGLEKNGDRMLLPTESAVVGSNTDFSRGKIKQRRVRNFKPSSLYAIFLLWLILVGSQIHFQRKLRTAAGWFDQRREDRSGWGGAQASAQSRARGVSFSS